MDLTAYYRLRRRAGLAPFQTEWGSKASTPTISRSREEVLAHTITTRLYQDGFSVLLRGVLWTLYAVLDTPGWVLNTLSVKRLVPTRFHLGI